MRSILLSVAVFGLAALMITVDGCSSDSSSNGNAPRCGSGDSCSVTDPVCSRPCGDDRQILCECGTGLLDGRLICGACNPIDDDGPTATGGRAGRGTAGATASGGRSGSGGRAGGTGGAMAASGGRMGRGSTGGAAAASGGRTGSTGSGGAVSTGSGGATGSGGSTPAVTPNCPADVLGGTSPCTATTAPICRTECVNGLYNICTCVAGSFLCPSNQIACM